MTIGRVPVVVLAIFGLLVPSIAGAKDSVVQGYGANDRAVTALNLLPPGQGRYMNSAELLQAQAGGGQPPHNTDQIELYDSLVQGTPGLDPAQVADYFKDATFGVDEGNIERSYEPRAGVTVVRDAAFGVPHVYGEKRGDVMFGAGYVSAEDRMFMMDVLRHAGRGNLSEFLGASPANLQIDRIAYSASGYTEEELQAMIDRGPKLAPKLGGQAVQDVQDYTDGINAYIDEATLDPSKLPGEYPALQVLPEAWKPTDTVAIASLIGSVLGVGGGSELGNAAFLNGLMEAGHNYKTARRILADFRFADDPESPNTVDRRFDWLTHLGPVNRKSVAMPDRPGQTARRVERATALPDHIDGPFGPIRLAFPKAASNALLVGRKLSKTGRPLAVMGPQTAYWSPEILMEIDMHGPGIDARGIGFPGISLYVLIGRGRDYGWSATSAGGDLVDIFAEELCNPDGGEVSEDSTFYMKEGKCVEMYTRTDSWFAKPTAGGIPDPSSGSEAVLVEMTTQRTDDGIVQARGTVGGKPVAFVRKRSSWGAEVDSAIAYVEMLNPAVIKGARDFQRAFARFSFTFNWFYLDGKDIAYQLGGYHPLRARGVDIDLPVWGDGRWSWRGRLSFKNTPKAISPRSGFIVSWNNRQAPGFSASDGEYSYGPVHRSQLLSDHVIAAKRAGRKFSVADIVNIMGDAATVDLRGYRVLPFMLRVLGQPKDDRLREAIGLLRSWQRSGAHREAAEPDGDYLNSPAIALMDEWWSRALEAIFKPVLRDAFDDVPVAHDNPPGSLGSAYQYGWYGHVQKDLRTLLGLRVRGKFSRDYCGKGSLARCREALQSSLEAAIAALEERFGGGPSTWDVDESVDQIKYTTLGIQGQDPMQWQNRPTFQQVLQFRR